MDLDNIIDYSLIAKSIDYYKSKGYEEKNVNWKIDKEIALSTLNQFINPDNVFFRDNFSNKVWVGSSEQSFIELCLNNNLKPGRYQSTTPCFRHEPVIDNLHKEYFIKTELFINDEVDYDSLLSVIEDCFDFYLKFFDFKFLKIIETSFETGEISYDITYKDIELGSYGIRSYKNLKWIYATGCSEARTTYCRKLT